MLKKIISVLVLFAVAGFGIFLIAILSGRVNPSSTVQNEAPPTTAPGKKEEVVGLKEILDFEKANDVVVGKLTTTGVQKIKAVKLEAPGFVVVYKSEDTSLQSVVGYSRLLEGGESDDVYLILRRQLLKKEVLYIGLRFDDGDGFFDYTGKLDKNLQRADGKVILWKTMVE